MVVSKEKGRNSSHRVLTYILSLLTTEINSTEIVRDEAKNSNGCREKKLEV